MFYMFRKKYRPQIKEGELPLLYDKTYFNKLVWNNYKQNDDGKFVPSV